MSEHPPQTTAVLARTKTFQGLPQAVLESFAQYCHLRLLHTGKTLFCKGDAVSVIGVGRLHPCGGSENVERALGEIGALETIGEIAMLAAEQHTATVRAVCDSAVPADVMRQFGRSAVIASSPNSRCWRRLERPAQP